MSHAEDVQRNRDVWTKANAEYTDAKGQKASVLDNAVLVFGQMNEPPGARLRVALTGLTMAEYFRDVFLARCTCRLVLFRYADTGKDPRRVQVLASAPFRPEFGDAASAGTFSLERFLGSTQAQVNFAIGNGLGVAVVVEATSPSQGEG